MRPGIPQAYLYYTDAFRCDPNNVDVINWLGAYYVRSQYAEKALTFFQKGAHVQPNAIHWWLMVAGCHRRNGDIRRAIEAYQTAHKKFPEHVNCLKLLVKLCSDSGMKEAADYERKLKVALRTERMRMMEENMNRGSMNNREDCAREVTSSESNRNLNRKLGGRPSSAMGDGPLNDVDGRHGSYSDPLGSSAVTKRPPTACRHTPGGTCGGTVTFDNEALGDDLLPD